MNTHNLQSSSPLVALLTVVAIVGCDDPRPEPSTLRDGYECPRWQCGYNSSEINGKSLQELHLGGQANADGVELVGFLPPAGVLYGWQLDVDGDALVARGGLFGSSTLRGDQLVGSTILLELDGALTVPVVIADYEEVDSWASNGEPIAAYALVYADLEHPEQARSVCKGTLVDPLQAAVVILAGERYDLDTKTVIANQEDWFTLACAGSAAAKMALLGDGPHAEFTDQSTPATVDQRQATLKMITADYCGDGHSYTEAGTAIGWENQAGTVVSEGDLGVLEAIWTEDGAACLDAPRVVELDEVACMLPSCDTFTLDDLDWASYSLE